ncbi:MAG: hypothetical protein ACRD0D_00975 [Acidimicrobiales bacterium]
MVCLSDGQSDLSWERQGPWNVFSDGTVLPVVGGGNGEGATGAGTSPPPDGGATGAGPSPLGATGAAPPDGGATGADPFDDPAQVTFDRAYVERVRREAAERRTALRPYSEAFDGYGDEDRAVWLDAARLYRSDPRAVASWMIEQGQAVLGGAPGAEPPAAAGGEGDELDRPLTRRDLDAFFGQREQRAAAAQREREMMAAIQAEARALGYEPGTDLYADLVGTALNRAGGDLAKADGLLKAARQKVIDEYVTAQAATAGASPRPGPAGVNGAVPPAPPRSWQDVRKMTRERLAQMG